MNLEVKLASRLSLLDQASILFANHSQPYIPITDNLLSLNNVLDLTLILDMADTNNAPIDEVEPQLEEDPAPTPRPATPIGADKLVKCCECDEMVNSELAKRCPNNKDGSQCQHDIGDCCPPA